MSLDVFALQKTSPSGGAYFISGDDGYLVKTAEDFFRGILPENSLSLHIIDKLTDVNEISSRIGVYSFDGLPSVVLVRDLDAKLDDTQHNQLLSFLSRSIAPDYLVFCNVNFLTASEKKLLTLIDCSRPNITRCLEFIDKLFPNGIEKSASYLLAEYTENDFANIYNESKKLNAYADGRAITVRDVENLVHADKEVQIFAFTNSVVSGKNATCLAQLETLRKTISPAVMLSALSNQYLRMLCCALSPLSDEELASLMKVKPFAIKKTRSLKSGSVKQLKQSLDMLIDCEYKFKSGVISEETALNIALSKLLKQE